MDLSSVFHWVQASPYHAAEPFFALVVADWVAGSAVAIKKGEFQKVKVYDWVKTTVGYQKLAAIVSSVALAYFLNGQGDANAAFLALVAVNGPAAVIVGHDVVEKVKAFFSS